MAINLKKGGTINLQKERPGIQHVTIGLGWDVSDGASPYDFDCDASLFMLGDNNKLVADEYFVFYNNLNSPDGAVHHTGDNRTGAGDGDDESINVDLARINPAVSQLVVAITIDQAEERHQDFGMITGSFARIYNSDTNEVLCQYYLDQNFPGTNALIIGRLYRSGNSWEFEAMDYAYQGGLQELVDIYA